MIESHVTSLELSKRLKELGVPQTSSFCWAHWNQTTPQYEKWELRQHNNTLSHESVSAFLASELGEMLPAVLDSQLLHFAKGVTEKQPWHAYYELFSGQQATIIIEDQAGDTEPDARAKLLIHLIEQGIIDPKTLNKENV